MTAGISRISGAVAVLLEDGIDTDVIFPARFLLRMDKAGLGECLFADRRAQGGFGFDRADGRPVSIILGGAQFGCGSSREHAVWSLVDHGVRAVLAPSFGEIFANNAARGGLAAIVLARETIEQLAAADGDLTVDLEARTIAAPGMAPLGFEMGEGDRQALINGWDEIDMLDVAHGDDIERFEAAYRQRRDWLFRQEG